MVEIFFYPCKGHRRFKYFCNHIFFLDVFNLRNEKYGPPWATWVKKWL